MPGGGRVNEGVVWCVRAPSKSKAEDEDEDEEEERVQNRGCRVNRMVK